MYLLPGSQPAPGRCRLVTTKDIIHHLSAFCIVEIVSKLDTYGGERLTCIKCRQEIPEGSLYCNHCGKKQQTTQRKRGVKPRGNGTGTVYRDGKYWRAKILLGYYVDEDGKKRAHTKSKGGFSTKKEALEYIPTLQAAVENNDATALSDYWEFYERKKLPDLSHDKQVAYKIAWKKWSPIAHRKIETLKIETLQAVLDEAATTYYPARDMKVLLSHFYKHAMSNQTVSINMSQFLQLPPSKPSERIPFNADELNAMWKDYTDGNRFMGYLLLMIYSGMMPGELLQARKDQINWETNQIIGAGLKTDIRKATPIVLADCIIPVLQDLVDHSPGDKLIHINKDNFYKQYYETLERIGARKLAPYSCRHTTGTDLAKEAVPPSIIQAIMRHSKITTTQRYIYIDSATALEGVNRLKAPKNPEQQPE